MILFWVLVHFLFPSQVTHAAACESRGPNVILFTVDGVRPWEFFKGTSPTLGLFLPKSKRGSLMKRFWSKHADAGVVYGGWGLNSSYVIGAKIAVSQPSYHAMLLGRLDSCKNNRCGRVKSETSLEKIRRVLGLPKKDVAVISSWKNIAFSVEHQKGNLMLNTGMQDMPGSEFQKTNQQQRKDAPLWDHARKDRYTLDHAFRYLKTHCPRAMMISLGDADEWAHRRNYTQYTNSIRSYDRALDQLIGLLDHMGDYGKNTTVYFTTDHGRGIGPLWNTHHITPWTEKNIFLYIKGPSTPHLGRVRKGKHRSHLDLRPDMEARMGI